jgi:glycosyltransferase involved in cell wall biosynthesis
VVKILHVTDCFNGGVQEVIEAIIESANSCEHYLLFDIHENDPHDSPAYLKNIKCNASNWKRGPLNRIRQLQSIVNESSIDLVHYHSSWAGFYGRISIPKRLNIYSSHGFGFERKDISIILRSLIYTIEVLLRFRTNTYIANWPNEYKIARKIYFKNSIKYAPIIIDKLMSNPFQSRIHPGEKFQVATIGRITQAKDPAFFLKVKKRLECKNNIEWHWLGDGTSSSRQDLESAGVHISGWLSKTDLSKRLENIQVVLITSLWDAGPITLYLAVSLGIPVVIRDFPAGKIFGLNHGWTVEEFCTSLQSLIDVQKHETITRVQLDRVREVTRENSPSNIGDIYQMLGRKNK